MFGKTRLLGCLCILTGLASLTLFAQVDTGVLSGYVYDNTSAVIPLAKVAVTNTRTN